MIKSWLKQAVLWSGLMLCVYALWHFRQLVGDASSRIAARSWISIGLLLTLCWCFGVMAWRQYLHAYIGQEQPWRVAARQLGLLLVGKYVPGGVFGFLARVYDQPEVSRPRVFWAGLAEQAVGMGLSFALGGLLYLIALSRNLVWMSLITLLPLLAVLGVRILHLAVGLSWFRACVTVVPFPGRLLLSAVIAQLVQQLIWVALVVVLANELYGLNIYAAFGVAGAFWLAVGLGVLMVFVPGGIGVREAALVGISSLWLDTAQAIVLSALLRLFSSILDVGAGSVAAMLGPELGSVEKKT